MWLMLISNLLLSSNLLHWLQDLSPRSGDACCPCTVVFDRWKVSLALLGYQKWR